MPRVYSRRSVIASGVGAAIRTPTILFGQTPPPASIEHGAYLRILHINAENIDLTTQSHDFETLFNVQINIDSTSVPHVDFRAGYDVLIAPFSTLLQLQSALTDMRQQAPYLGSKYGGWWPVAAAYGLSSGWTSLPLAAQSSKLVYRRDFLASAGYGAVPRDPHDFLTMGRRLADLGHPIGFPLGPSRAANSWSHWLLWAFGGAVHDESGRIALRSPETLHALSYARELVPLSAPGSLSWLSGGRAFLGGEVSATYGTAWIYKAAGESGVLDPDLIRHADMPIGPVGIPTERSDFLGVAVPKSSAFPDTAKAYVQFLFEEEQYQPWLSSALGEWGSTLGYYRPTWDNQRDRNVVPYTRSAGHTLWDGYRGPLSWAAERILEEFVVLRMVLEAGVRAGSPQDAMEQAVFEAEGVLRGLSGQSASWVGTTPDEQASEERCGARCPAECGGDGCVQDDAGGYCCRITKMPQPSALR